MSFPSVTTGDPGMRCSAGREVATAASGLARGFARPAVPGQRPGSETAALCPRCALSGSCRPSLVPAKSGPRRGRCAEALLPQSVSGAAMQQPPLPAGLSARTFPAKLWHLVNSPRVRSVRWDSLARGLLVERSLFERELLSPAGARGLGGEGAAAAPGTFKATQFSSFLRQLHLYGFHKVASEGGSWLHFRNPIFRRDRPDLLLRIERRSKASQGGAPRRCSKEVRSRQRSRLQQLRGAAPSCQDLRAASPEDAELPPGPSRRRRAGAEDSEVSPAPAKKVFRTSGHQGESWEESIRRKFQLKRLTIPLVRMDLKHHPELMVRLVRIDHPSVSRALPESSSCTSSEQHLPAYSPSAALCQDLSAASPEDSELPPGPSSTSAADQGSEASPVPPKKVFPTSGHQGDLSEKPEAGKFQCHPELTSPPVPIDHPSVSRALPESSSCISSEQHLPACSPSATVGSSAPDAATGSAGCAAWTASSWPWNEPGEEELPPLTLDLVLETLEEMLSRSPPERSTFAQGNTGVTPESSGGEPENMAAAERDLPGTVSHGNSSLEPEELDIHLIYLARRAALRGTRRPRESL